MRRVHSLEEERKSSLHRKNKNNIPISRRKERLILYSLYVLIAAILGGILIYAIAPYLYQVENRRLWNMLDQQENMKDKFLIATRLLTMDPYDKKAHEFLVEVTADPENNIDYKLMAKSLQEDAIEELLHQEKNHPLHLVQARTLSATGEHQRATKLWERLATYRELSEPDRLRWFRSAWQAGNIARALMLQSQLPSSYEETRLDLLQAASREKSLFLTHIAAEAALASWENHKISPQQIVQVLHENSHSQLAQSVLNRILKGHPAWKEGEYQQMLQKLEKPK